ncbi:MAG: hypothetical protein AAGG54_00730, partial [Pseudomonadota bacterium]
MTRAIAAPRRKSIWLKANAGWLPPPLSKSSGPQWASSVFARLTERFARLSSFVPPNPHLQGRLERETR